MAILDPNETYYVFADADGDTYTRGRYTQSDQYPYSSSDLDIVTGVYTDKPHTTDNGRYNFSAIRAILDSGDGGAPTYGSTTTTPADDNDATVSSPQGVGFEPNAELDGIEVTLSENIVGATTAWIQNSFGDILTSVDISTLTAGDTIDLVTIEEVGTPSDPITIEWTTQSDWENARSREHVLTQNVPGREALGFVWQAWDPDYPLVSSHIDAYWTLGESSGTTAQELISGDNGTYVNSPGLGQTGLLSGNAAGFDGDTEYVDLGVPAAMDHGGDFSVLMGVRRKHLYERETLIAHGFDVKGAWSLDVRGHKGMRFCYTDKKGRTRGCNFHKYEMDRDWHWVGLSWDDSRRKASVYLDGDKERRKIGGYGRPRPEADAYIAREPGYRQYSFKGQICDVMYSQKDLSSTLQREFENTIEDDGKLVTSSKTHGARAKVLETDSVVPGGSKCKVTVHQDVSGSGTADNKQTIKLDGGVESHTLTGFAASPGARYWLTIETSTYKMTRAPRIERATLELEQVAGTVIISHGGVWQSNEAVLRTK